MILFRPDIRSVVFQKADSNPNVSRHLIQHAQRLPQASEVQTATFAHALHAAWISPSRRLVRTQQRQDAPRGLARLKESRIHKFDHTSHLLAHL